MGHVINTLSCHLVEAFLIVRVADKLLEVKLHNGTISVRRGNELSPLLARAFLTEAVYSSCGTLIIQLIDFELFY